MFCCKPFADVSACYPAPNFLQSCSPGCPPIQKHPRPGQDLWILRGGHDPAQSRLAETPQPGESDAGGVPGSRFSGTEIRHELLDLLLAKRRKDFKPAHHDPDELVRSRVDLNRNQSVDGLPGKHIEHAQAFRSEVALLPG